MFRPLIIALAALAGCGSPCASVWEIYPRDLCLAQASADAARAGDLREATRILDDIDGLRVRATAVEWIVSLNPPGMDRSGAVKLCDSLGDTFGPRCRSSWDRPELWESP